MNKFHEDRKIELIRRGNCLVNLKRKFFLVFGAKLKLS